ncbi:MAG: mechanosensitive ion channel [Agathobacter sp.]|nr:mechanosensitive ion channel [Agathobacter sp.]
MSEELKAYLDGAIPAVLDFLMDIVWVAVFLIVGMKLIGMLVKFLKKVMTKANVEAGVASFLGSLVKYILYFVLVMIILSQFGVTAGSVVAVLGSAGVTVGLALQGSLSNFAGGVLILLLKPFVVGDYIIENSGGMEGTVKEITIFYTKLLTPDNKAILIPNGTLSNTSIINASAMDKRRIDIEVGVAYNSDLSKVKAVLSDVIMKDEARLEAEEANVFVSLLGDSSITMGVRLWVKSDDYWAAKWRITENIKLEFDKNNIEIPFPQMDVNLKK